MYESFFKLTKRPFVASPLVKNYFPGELIEQAHQTLTRIIDRAEGPGLIVGPAGVGKTMLCRLLAERFRETFEIALLSSTRLVTRKALLQNILFELGLPYRGLEEGELRLALLDHLQPSSSHSNGLLLIVDEAHTIGLRLLEEIRMITNLVREGQPRVRLILAGGPKLEERFANPKLESFNQRIAARCYLEAFGRDETIEYVRRCIASAGGEGASIFSDDALHAVYRATDGIPRLINQVCDHALVMAFAGGRRQLDGTGIEEAWADLQQLPGPWQEKPEAAADGSAIEFGTLDDEPADGGAVAEFAAVETIAYGGQAETPSETATNQPAEPVVKETISLAEQEPEIAREAQPETAADETGNVIETPVVLNPFGDDFEDEEIVIDQLTVTEAEAFSNRPLVSSAEGRELSASLQELDDDAGKIEDDPGKNESDATEEIGYTVSNDPPEPSSVDDVDSANKELVEALPVAEEVPPVADSQMFEYTVFEANSDIDATLEALCEVNLALGNLDEAREAEIETETAPTVRLADHRPETPDEQAGDDRDIIVVEDPPSDAALPDQTPPSTNAVQQVGYQELFSQLRQG